MTLATKPDKDGPAPRIVISIQPERPRKISQAKASLTRLYVLVTAHPDDESMFFLPTILSLLRGGATVWLICLTCGGYDGLGNRRKLELMRVAEMLKVHKLMLVENSDILDHPVKAWNVNTVASSIESAIHSALKDLGTTCEQLTFITFDRLGVSGHINHRDAHFGVGQVLLNHQRSHQKGLPVASLDAWQLETVPVLEKYLPVSEWLRCILVLCSLWRPHDGVIMFPNRSQSVVEYRSSDFLRHWKAMAIHESQFVWYRRLFVVFSFYTYCNRLRPISTNNE